MGRIIVLILLMIVSQIPLHTAKRGAVLRIEGIPEGRNRALLLRLGILKGEVVRCLERLPGGTVVLEKNRQEIAVGFDLASTIIVAVIPDHQPGTTRK